MDEESTEFAVKAVVLNGRVVLDAPINLPDGTLVTVRRYDEGDLSEDWEKMPSIAERVKQLGAMVDMNWVKLQALERAVRQGGPEAA